jgi:hypothetical protein
MIIEATKEQEKAESNFNGLEIQPTKTDGRMSYTIEDEIRPPGLRSNSDFRAIYL